VQSVEKGEEVNCYFFKELSESFVLYPWLFLFSGLDFGPDCLYYWITRTTSEGTYRPQPWKINVRPGQLVVTEEWPALEHITLKAQVHPSHCGIGKLKLHTTHKRKGKSNCWSCWLSTIHALKVGKHPFPICEHSYIFTATSCLPGLVYIRSESLDVFSAFRGSLGGSSSQIHWIDTCTLSIAICILQSLAASCHMKSMFGSKVWMERFMLYISSNLFANPINKYTN